MSLVTSKKGALRVRPRTIHATQFYPLDYSGAWIQAAYITDWDMKVKKSTFDNSPFPTQQAWTDETGAVGEKTANTTYYDKHFAWSESLIDKVGWSGSASAYYDVNDQATSAYAQNLLQSSIISTNNYTSRIQLQLFVNFVPLGENDVRYYEGEAVITDIDIKASAGSIVAFDFGFEGYGELTYHQSTTKV